MRNAFLLVALIVSSAAYAQVQVGVFAGVSNYTGDVLDKPYHFSHGAFGFSAGAQFTKHFAARAALQTGFIFEQRGDKATAIQWFQRCMDMKDHDFKNSLDQRAKAGIARCKNE